MNVNLNKRLLLQTEHTDSHSLPTKQLITSDHYHSVAAAYYKFNPLNAELNPICYLLALLGAHHFLHVSRIRVKSLTLRLLMSYIYMGACGSAVG